MFKKYLHHLRTKVSFVDFKSFKFLLAINRKICIFKRRGIVCKRLFSGKPVIKFFKISITTDFKEIYTTFGQKYCSHTLKVSRFYLI